MQSTRPSISDLTILSLALDGLLIIINTCLVYQAVWALYLCYQPCQKHLTLSCSWSIVLLHSSAHGEVLLEAYLCAQADQEPLLPLSSQSNHCVPLSYILFWYMEIISLAYSSVYSNSSQFQLIKLMIPKSISQFYTTFQNSRTNFPMTQWSSPLRYSLAFKT